MKKRLIILLVFMLGLFLIPTIVNAEEDNPIIESTTSEEVVELTNQENETNATEGKIEGKIEESVDIVKEWFNEFFSPDKVANYIQWFTLLGIALGLFANWKKLKVANNLTLKNVSDKVEKLLQENISTSIASQFQKVVPSILNTQEKTNDIMTIFAKILTLSQENTPESKVAILNLIEELGVVGKQVVENSKIVVEEAKKAEEKAKEELDTKIDEIVESYDGTSI